MTTLRIDLTGDDIAARELINLLGSIDGVDSAEEIADLMPHMDDDDSSSAGLVDDASPGFHKIEVHASRSHMERVRDTVETFARAREVVVEFDDDEDIS